MDRKGKFPKKSKKKKKKDAEEGILKVSNPLQEADEPSDEDDEPQAPSPAKKHFVPNLHIAETLHHLEEVVVKDVHLVEEELVKDVKIIGDDIKIVGQVGVHLAGTGAKASADAAKALTGVGVNAGLLLGDALMGNELAKVERTFSRIDVDGSGFLDREELKLLMSELGKECTEPFLDRIMAEMDPGGDGEVSLEEFKDWWVRVGYNSSVLGDSVGIIKDLSAAPILIFYHMFDENSEWFLTLGDAGIPLRMVSDIITWSLNFLQLVWSTASICETVQTMSPDPNRNPEGWEWWGSFWWWTNLVCAFLFFSEWSCRIVGSVASGNLKPFLKDRMSYIDLLTNISGISMVFGLKLDQTSMTFTTGASGTSLDCRWLRIIRLSRVLKTMRNERINNLAPVVWEILSNSAVALMIPVFLLLIMGQVTASMFYLVEQHEFVTCELPNGVRIDHWEPTIAMNDGCQVEYQCPCPGSVIYQVYNYGTGEYYERSFRAADDIWHAWWWAIVTITTVGYGDMSPITFLGQVVGACTGFLGLLIVAMPISIVGGSFHDSYAHLEGKLAKAKKKRDERLALREKLKKQKKERDDLRRRGLLPDSPKATDTEGGNGNGSAIKRAMSTDAKLAKNAAQYSGERQDVLLYLQLALEKVQKLERKLNLGLDVDESAPRSDIGQVCDTLADLRQKVDEVWPAERELPPAPAPAPEPKPVSNEDME
jgi:hypothetical protein